jgi:hypothetical protein
VLFEGTGNVLQQSSSLFWDNTNSRLGIRTATFWGSVQQLIVGSATEGRLGVSNSARQGVYLGQISNVAQIFAYDYTANASRFLAINSFGGNVGIGTTTDAGFKLDVNGTARVSGILSMSSATGGYAYLQDTSALAAINVIAMQNVGGNYAILSRTSTGGYVADHYGIVVGSASNSYQRWMTSGSERMRLVSNGNLLIGTTTDVASSKLTVESTTQGFLPPRMTTTQKNAIASPAAGLVVYDTTLGKLCVRGAAAWETITSI